MVQGWLLVVGIEKPVEFFPDIEPKGIYVNTDMPEGADLNYIDNILRQIEEAVAGKGNSSDENLSPRQNHPPVPAICRT